MTRECNTHHGPLPGGHGHGIEHAHPAPHTHSVGGLEGHRPKQRRALVWSMGLSFVVMAAEVVGGLVTGSLMLLSDAVHMLSHVVALAVSYFAIWMASRPRTPRSHYGLYRAEILGSLANGVGLLLLCGWIVYEAAVRLGSPVEVMGVEMMAVAVLGLVTNVATAWILSRSGAEDLNTKSALMHMLGDLFSSVVIVIGGIVLIYTGWNWLDPALSMVVALVVLVWGFGLVRASVSILLERAPAGVEPDDVLAAMRSEPGVKGVHDLHVWEITSGYVCLTAHVVVDDTPVSEAGRLRESLCELLRDRFHVAHVTLQLETA